MTSKRRVYAPRRCENTTVHRLWVIWIQRLEQPHQERTQEPAAAVAPAEHAHHRRVQPPRRSGFNRQTEASTNQGMTLVHSFAWMNASVGRSIRQVVVTLAVTKKLSRGLKLDECYPSVDVHVDVQVLVLLFLQAAIFFTM